jgi:3-oxoacyl-[acyl-carrier protein] reductase
MAENGNGRLRGRSALVTGGSRGIGRAIALRLASEGANVAVCARNEEAAAATAAEVAHSGVGSLSRGADVSDAGQVKDLVAATIAEFGALNILVNNAGIARDNLTLRLQEADWDAVLEINLKGAFLCCKAAARSMMKAREGRIINISSVVGIAGNAGQPNYAASKAGLLGFTKSLARELAPRNITVNAVAPGLVPDTGMTTDLGEEAVEQLLSHVPLGRPGSAEDVAAAVAFLASEEAAYITGHVLTVDGGMTM